MDELQLDPHATQLLQYLLSLLRQRIQDEQHEEA